MTQPGFNKRIARRISRVDQQRLDRGEAPSWAQHNPVETGHGHTTHNKGVHGHDRPHPDDQRLLEDLPPHWRQSNQ